MLMCYREFTILVVIPEESPEVLSSVSSQKVGITTCGVAIPVNCSSTYVLLLKAHGLLWRWK